MVFICSVIGCNYDHIFFYTKIFSCNYKEMLTKYLKYFTFKFFERTYLCSIYCTGESGFLSPPNIEIGFTLREYCFQLAALNNIWLRVFNHFQTTSFSHVECVIWINKMFHNKISTGNTFGININFIPLW